MFIAKGFKHQCHKTSDFLFCRGTDQCENMCSFLFFCLLVHLRGCHHLQLRCSKVSRKEGNPLLGSVLLGSLSCCLLQRCQCHLCGLWGSAREFHEAPAEFYNTQHKHTQTTSFMRQISTNYTNGEKNYWSFTHKSHKLLYCRSLEEWNLAALWISFLSVSLSHTHYYTALLFLTAIYSF